jgi:hypothetical protein
LRESGETRSTYRRLERCGDSREEDHLEDVGVDGEIIVRCIFHELAWGGIDWVELAQDTD